MPAERRLSEGPIGRAVREALGSIAAAEQQREILDLALYLARVETVPEAPLRAHQFVHGALWHATANVFGEQSADAVVRDLDPIIDLAQSQVSPKVNAPRRSDREPELPGVVGGRRSTPPSRPRDETATPVVLFATRDRAGSRDLARELGDLATVRAVNDVVQLLHGLDVGSRPKPVVVLDCRLPSVDPGAAASLLAGFEDPPQVVLRGAEPEEQASFEAAAPATCEWVTLGADATDSDLAALLAWYL